MTHPAATQKAPTVSASKRNLIMNAIKEVRSFRFCGPSDDLDEQTAVTLGFRYLVIQLKRLACPILPETAASQLNAIDVEVDNLYSAFDAKAELDALLPDVKSVLEHLEEETEIPQESTAATPLSVPICSIVGEVLGSFIYHHKTLEALFYEAGASGEVPAGNCVVKCQTWLKRMHNEAPVPSDVLGKLLEEFMEVDHPFREEEQETGRKRINEILARFGLSYHQGGLILGAANALPTKSLNHVLKDRDLTGVDKEFARALANVEKDPPTAITAACSILESLFKTISKTMASKCQRTRA